MKTSHYTRASVGLRGFVILGCLLSLGVGVSWAQETQPKTLPAPTEEATKEAPVVEDTGCELSPAEQLLVTELRQALTDLETRRLLLESKENALLALRKQLQKDMEKLRKLQKEISAELDRQDQKRKDDRERRIAQLANLLRKMRPENAANIIDVTEDALAVATLDRLGERQASKLLEALPPARAVELAKQLLALPFQQKEKK